MGFKFNPTTGLLDLVGQAGTVTANTEKLIKSFVAGENISALKLVYASSPTEVSVCSLSSYDLSRAIGVAITAATTGNSLNVQLFGKLEDASFTFAFNEDLYLNINGSITNSYPSSGYNLQVGYGMGTGAIFIDIEKPITLA